MIRRISERVIWVGTVAFLAILAAGAVAYTRVEVLTDATSWVSHTERVRFVLQRTLSTLEDGESAVRGYFITREDPFLEPYWLARSQLDADLQSLLSLVEDSASQMERARQLSQLGHARLKKLDDSVVAIRNGTFVMPKAPLATSDSKKLMDAFRALVASMQADEDGKLAERLRTADHAHKTALLATVLTSMAAGALVLLLVLVGRRAAADIRRSEQWLATTLSSIGDGVIATDADGSIRFLNPVAVELTGWSQFDARGRPLEEVFRVVSEIDRRPTENPVAQVLREGTLAGASANMVLIRRDGAEFPIEDSGSPIRGDGGEINGVVVVFKDATASRASQMALQASEERQRLAIDSAELGTMDNDLRSGNAVWNDRLYAIVGYPVGTPATVAMMNLHTAAEDVAMVERAAQQARDARGFFRCEYRIARASDQSQRWISANGRYVYDNEGRAERFVCVVRDVTEYRRLESQARQSQKLDALGTLAGGIAHDFNNLLAVLRGNLSILREETAPDSPQVPNLQDMEQACNRATALVRQILTFGQRQEQDLRVLQLEAVISESIKMLRSTLPAEIDIRFSAATSLPPALVDPNQIHQVITNLGINASHAIGRSQGCIEIQLDATELDNELATTLADLKPGRYLRLRFSDNGSGMPRQVMERIFEPFYTTKGPNRGTGLGLSVVTGILKNHNAAITVYSEPGRGTRFYLYFPVAAEAQQSAAPTNQAGRRGRGERILYIDDEESLVILAKRMLERMGYRVAGFKDAAQALAVFAAAPEEFDLVLTDLSMPGMSGMEVAHRILEIRPDIPVLLATGYVRSEDVEQARAIGIREVIWKPQTIGEMGDVLAQQLEKLVPA